MQNGQGLWSGLGLAGALELSGLRGLDLPCTFQNDRQICRADRVVYILAFSVQGKVNSPDPGRTINHNAFSQSHHSVNMIMIAVGKTSMFLNRKSQVLSLKALYSSLQGTS